MTSRVIGARLHRDFECRLLHDTNGCIHTIRSVSISSSFMSRYQNISDDAEHNSCALQGGLRWLQSMPPDSELTSYWGSHQRSTFTRCSVALKEELSEGHYYH